MFALSWIIFSFFLLVQIGVIYSVLLKPETKLASQILLHSVYALAIVVVFLFGLHIFIPVGIILNPIIYLIITVLSVLGLFRLRPRIDRVCVVAALIYLVFGFFLFQQEIQLNSAVSFGGNGDFFNQERMLKYVNLFNRVEHPLVNAAYSETQWRIGNTYHYPLGATYLLSFFGDGIQLLVSSPIITSFHKIFFCLSVMTCFLILQKRNKSFYLALLTSTIVFSLPILHSMVGMDFVPQEAVIPFVLIFLGLLQQKKMCWEIVLLVTAIGITFFLHFCHSDSS